MAHRIGAQFYRPTRFLTVPIVSFFWFLIASISLGLFALGQGRAELARACGGSADAGWLLCKYFVVLTVFVSLGFTVCFTLKEIPAIAKRRPNAYLSLVGIPVAVTALSALTIPLFAGTAFFLRELLGEMGIIFGAALGVGLADYLYDKREAADSSDTAVGIDSAIHRNESIR